jgi:hypothetical protein
METLMNMPVADRKFYIVMHNRSQSETLDEEF